MANPTRTFGQQGASRTERVKRYYVLESDPRQVASSPVLPRNFYRPGAAATAPIVLPDSDDEEQPAPQRRVPKPNGPGTSASTYFEQSAQPTPPKHRRLPQQHVVVKGEPLENDDPFRVPSAPQSRYIQMGPPASPTPGGNQGYTTDLAELTSKSGVKTRAQKKRKFPEENVTEVDDSEIEIDGVVYRASAVAPYPRNTARPRSVLVSSSPDAAGNVRVYHPVSPDNSRALVVASPRVKTEPHIKQESEDEPPMYRGHSNGGRHEATRNQPRVVNGTNMNDHPPLVQETIAYAKQVVRLQHATVHLYPTAGMKETFIDRAIVMANKKAKKRLPPEQAAEAIIDPRYHPNARQLCSANSTWMRSRLKAHAQTIVVTAYAHYLSPNLTVKGRRDAVAWLLENNNYIYAHAILQVEEGIETTVRKGPFRHPAIEQTIEAAFYGKGTSGDALEYPELFSSMPLPVIAAAAVAVCFALQQYGSGLKDSSHMFLESKYSADYQILLKNLERYDKERHNDCVALQKDILAFVTPRAAANSGGSGEDQEIFMTFDDSEEI